MSEHNVVPLANNHAVLSAGAYSNEAERIAAAVTFLGTPLATDVGRVALQTDNNSLWVWTGVLWRHLAGPKQARSFAGTTYAPTINDLDSIISSTGAAGAVATIPLVASLVGIKVGDGFAFRQVGAGQLTLAHVSGASNIKSTGTLLAKGQYAFLYAEYQGSDLWFVTGDRA